jgi:hypothetical protein
LNGDEGEAADVVAPLPNVVVPVVTALVVALKVTAAPEQITEGETLAFTTGIVVFSVVDAVLAQPLTELLAFTLYVVPPAVADL